MAEFIPSGVEEVPALALYTERALQDVERTAKKCTVPTFLSSDDGESKFFIDNGVLKFYNSSTGEVLSVTLT